MPQSPRWSTATTWCCCKPECLRAQRLLFDFADRGLQEADHLAYRGARRTASAQPLPCQCLGIGRVAVIQAFPFGRRRDLPGAVGEARIALVFVGGAAQAFVEGVE